MTLFQQLSRSHHFEGSELLQHHARYRNAELATQHMRGSRQGYGNISFAQVILKAVTLICPCHSGVAYYPPKGSHDPGHHLLLLIVCRLEETWLKLNWRGAIAEKNCSIPLPLVNRHGKDASDRQATFELGKAHGWQLHPTTLNVTTTWPEET